MLRIEWNDNIMNIGIEIIDTQHKKLVELINRITLSIEEENQKDNVEEFICDAMDYAGYHFKTEENLLTKMNIDKEKIEDHKKEHQNFLNNATNLYKDLKSDISNKHKYGIEMVTKLYRYLANWLVHHIVGEDKTLLLNT